MACWKLLPPIICLLIIFGEFVGFGKSEVTQFTAGRSFRIKNRNSNLYMTSKPERIQQHPLATGSDRAAQVWFVIPLEKDSYLIANKQTGLSLYELSSDVITSTFTKQGVPTFLPNSGRGETWEIKLDPAAASQGHFNTIKNQLTGNYLIIGGHSAEAGRSIHQWPFQELRYRASQHWVFEVEEEFPSVLEANRIVDRAAGDIGDIQRITSWTQPMPSNTDDVLIGQLAIPFPLIVDPRYNVSQQSTTSPYYFLRRYGYWRVVASHDRSDTVVVTMATNVTIGLITNNARAVENAIGLVVTAESSLGVKAPRATYIGSEIARGLKIMVDDGFTEVSSTTMLLERKYTTLTRQIHVVWIREDRFVLQRLNGDKVLEWVTRAQNTVGDTFRGRQFLTPSDNAISSNRSETKALD